VKFMQAAIIHEISRQTNILSNPEATVPQETRGFDEHSFETYKLRSKEDAPDYRYMPDPNLGVLRITQERIQRIKTTMPELPWETRTRLLTNYELSEKDADALLNIDSSKEVPFDGGSNDSGAAAYFDRICAGGRSPKIAFNWMTHELLGQLSALKKTFAENPLSTDQLGELIDLVSEGVITGTSGKLLLRHMLSHPSQASPTDIAHSLSLTALSPSSSTPDLELHTLCQSAIDTLPSEVTAFRKGNKNVLNKIVGQVMKQSRGRADARAVKDCLETILAEPQVSR